MRDIAAKLCGTPKTLRLPQSIGAAAKLCGRRTAMRQTMRAFLLSTKKEHISRERQVFLVFDYLHWLLFTIWAALFTMNYGLIFDILWLGVGLPLFLSVKQMQIWDKDIEQK